MSKKKNILIVFPDEWLQYSPSVLNFYKCCEENNHVKIVYFNNKKFKNDGLVSNYKSINTSKLASYIWRKTFGHKLYKVIKLFFALLFIKLFDKKYDLVVGVDSSGYAITKLFFGKTVYYSLETEKDNYYNFCKRLGIENLIIQSKERADFMLEGINDVTVFYIQNSPILDNKLNLNKEPKKKEILYMGNIEFGYGLEYFIDSIKDLPEEYSLTLKGIKNDKYYNWLISKYANELKNGKLVFDFNYVAQEKIIEYVSKYYIGITGYDLDLAKKSFNYYSSPAGKLFNYYAAGVPVIGINIIGLKSVTDFNAGVLIDSVNEQNIKEAIKTIESNYTVYSQNCIKASIEFDFKKGFNTFINNIDNDHNDSSRLKKFINKGHERSVKTKKNILASILIKCLSISISFILIPLALNYLNPTKYGIWLTLTSVIGWFGFFDLGLGNGLRNKLAEALAKNDIVSAKIFISTSYAVLSIIIGIVYTIFFLVFPHLNWSRVLNTPPEMSEEINKLIFIVFSFFCLQFIIKHISVILKADQKSAVSGGINTFASLLSLIFVFTLTKTTNGSLLLLSIAVSAANIVAPFFVTIWYFGTEYKHLIPSFKYVKLKYAKDLMSLGFMFFIMQFAALIIFSTDSYIIDQLFGPEAVTPYNIAFKYFSIITMSFAIITTPFWSAYTDAYHKGDFEWIKRITNKQIKFWYLTALGVIIMLACQKWFYHFWIGDKVSIPFSLSATMAVWVLISSWTSIFGNFLSGVEKIRLSLIHSILMIFINIPLSIFFAKNLNLGPTGVMIATCICVLPQVFLHPIQYKKIINNTATGIWIK